MKIIHHNPYRIAGILTNATTKELQKQKAKIKAFSKVGKTITSEYDFDFLDEIDRTEQTIEKAFSQIEQSHDKVNHSLFWFLKASLFDETAISYLVKGDNEKAKEIWGKITDNKEVSLRNYSAFNNIGTLKLLSKSKSDIKEGIEAKIKLIESDYFENFVHTVADQTFTIDSKKQSQILIDELLTQFINQYSSADALDLFSNCNGTTQKYLSKKFTERPIHNIESQIESTKRKRKNAKSEAYSFGLKLFVDIKDDLNLLKSLLVTSDLKFKMIADNLAKEIMQCGIDYFQEWKESKDPSEEGLKLLNFAKSIAVGSQTKERIKQNIEGIEEWAVTAPIQDDLNFITHKLQGFQNQSNTILNAQSFINSCKPKLQNIKSILGMNNSFYLDLSSAVVGNGLGMIIEVVNEAQTGLEYNRQKILILPSIISSAVNVINSLSSFDMQPQMRQRFNDQKSAINSINEQLETVRRQIKAATANSRSNEGGCYIATMAYGDYEHPQVIVLRRFRDNTLNKSIIGRSFIRTYYKYSPKLVELLKKQKVTNAIIKIMLNLFIKIIKKQ